MVRIRIRIRTIPFLSDLCVLCVLCGEKSGSAFHRMVHNFKIAAPPGAVPRSPGAVPDFSGSPGSGQTQLCSRGTFSQCVQDDASF